MTNIQELEQMIENEYNFRDYEILPTSAFGSNNKIGVHQLIDDLDNMDHDVNDAIYTFCRDGFPIIYFYVDDDDDAKYNNVINLSEYRAKRGA